MRLITFVLSTTALLLACSGGAEETPDAPAAPEATAPEAAPAAPAAPAAEDHESVVNAAWDGTDGRVGALSDMCGLTVGDLSPEERLSTWLEQLRKGVTDEALECSDDAGALACKLGISTSHEGMESFIELKFRIAEDKSLVTDSVDCILAG